MKIISKLKKFISSPETYARQIGVNIGERCRFNGHPSWGSEPWLVALGNHVELSSYVSFVTHDGGTWVFRHHEKYKDVKRFGLINIKDNCFIGTHSIILPNVTIGPNSIIGAGSVVTKDVPEGCVYAGVPAHFICSTKDYAEKCLIQTPDYDKSLYKTNKRKAVLQMLEGQKLS